MNAKGRRLIGWSEILEGGLAPNAALMDWKGGVEAATQAGHDVVMAPNGFYYFDYGGPGTTAERAYLYEPGDKLPPAQAKHVLGVEACFWSHVDREPIFVDHQIFPRLLAVAERGWSPAGTHDWPNFKQRLEAQWPRLRQLGIQPLNFETIGAWTPRQMTENYAPLLFEVTSKVTASGSYIVKLQYTKGTCRLGIKSAELLADGKVVAEDKHRGVTGAQDAGNWYKMVFTQYRPGARYQVRVSARSEGGTESFGEVSLCSATEPTPRARLN